MDTCPRLGKVISQQLCSGGGTSEDQEIQSTPSTCLPMRLSSSFKEAGDIKSSSKEFVSGLLYVVDIYLVSTVLFSIK